MAENQEVEKISNGIRRFLEVQTREMSPEERLRRFLGKPSCKMTLCDAARMIWVSEAGTRVADELIMKEAQGYMHIEGIYQAGLKELQDHVGQLSNYDWRNNPEQARVALKDYLRENRESTREKVINICAEERLDNPFQFFFQELEQELRGINLIVQGGEVPSIPEIGQMGQAMEEFLTVDRQIEIAASEPALDMDLVLHLLAKEEEILRQIIDMIEIIQKKIMGMKLPLKTYRDVLYAGGTPKFVEEFSGLPLGGLMNSISEQTEYHSYYRKLWLDRQTCKEGVKSVCEMRGRLEKAGYVISPGFDKIMKAFPAWALPSPEMVQATVRKSAPPIAKPKQGSSGPRGKVTAREAGDNKGQPVL